MSKKRRQMGGLARKLPLATALAGLVVGGNAVAFEIDTGNPDVAMRWDNTVRYNVGKRMQRPDSRIANYYVADEGDALFDKGDIVTNRLDLLSEFDFVYKRNFGFRVSGAAWHDAAYGSRGSSNPSAPPPPLLMGNPLIGSPLSSNVNNEFSSHTKRYTRGPSGEILDAFVFANFEAGDTPVKLKAGRHTVFWGESLLLGGAIHGISYSQMPLDIQKGQATPGAEAKELFRPLNQISTQMQVTDTLSLAAQYYLQWEAYRLPEGGTYLMGGDYLADGPQRIVLGTVVPFGNLPLGYTRDQARKPKDPTEFGLAARWSPEFLDGTLGLYYRRYADKVPAVLATRFSRAGAAFPLSALPVAATSQYALVYPKDIDLFGISLAKNIGGISVGAELSYRHDTPLIAPQFAYDPVNKVTRIGEGTGETPLGDTMHGVVNLLGTLPKTPLFDMATWAAEVTWSRVQKVSSHKELFQSVHHACSFALSRRPVGDKWDGCATRDFVGFGGNFTPTWYQVVPGVDLSMPLTYAVGVKGNAATTFGGNQGTGNYSFGLGADIHQRYRVDLKYISYFGRYRDNGTSVITQNGLNALIADRDWLSLTLKTSF